MYQFKTVGRLLSCFPSTYPKHPNQLLRSLSLTNDRHKVLPPELTKSTVRLTCKSNAKGGVCDVYVVGTMHYSPKSCQQVKAVVNFLKPQVVFLELCPNRAWQLHYEGNEFKVAYEEGRKYRAKVVLGDRPLSITSWRYYKKWAKMPPWHFIKSLFLVPFQNINYENDETMRKYVKAMKNDEYDDTLSTLFKERLRRYFPIYTETYVDERDQYMSAMLLKVANKHSLVVAVVGKAHLFGIQKYWEQNIEVKHLLS